MRIFLMTVFLAACSSATVDTNASTCEACLESTGTWQPEASACTVDCGLQDISCFTDECPGDCAADECGNCFSQADCEGATCTWTTMDETATCN